MTLSQEIGVTKEYADKLNAMTAKMIEDGATDDLMILNALLDSEKNNPNLKTIFEKKTPKEKADVVKCLHKNIIRMLKYSTVLFERD